LTQSSLFIVVSVGDMTHIQQQWRSWSSIRNSNWRDKTNF